MKKGAACFVGSFFYGIIYIWHKLDIDLGFELAHQFGIGSRIAPRIVPAFGLKDVN